MNSDGEIARAAQLKPIAEIGAKLGIPAQALIPYGHTKAKMSADFLKSLAARPDGDLVLVTAMNPTPAGEGKTTTTVGLGDALTRIGKRASSKITSQTFAPCCPIFFSGLPMLTPGVSRSTMKAESPFAPGVF